MLPSFLLALREGLEAALIIGITLSVLNKINRQDLKPSVWRGAAFAAGLSVVAALVLNWMGAGFEGRAEEIFEGVAMLLAAGLLTWMIFWMQNRAKNLRQEIEADTRMAAAQGGHRAMFFLAFFAVGREGIELALFLLAASVATSANQTLLGAILGLVVSGFLGWLLFATTRKLNVKAFFQVSSVLLILFAAGLVAHGVHEFNEAGLIPPVIEHVWDVNHMLDEKSTVGELLKALFGYNGNPSLTEVIAYIGYFAIIWLGLQRFSFSIKKPLEV